MVGEIRGDRWVKPGLKVSVIEATLTSCLEESRLQSRRYLKNIQSHQ